MKYLESLVKQGGPEQSDYARLLSELSNIDIDLNTSEHNELIALLESVLTIDTMQGFVHQKPHGYSGDYEIIDKIYIKWKTKNKDLLKWDHFFHDQAAVRAVRNRKDYFINLLRNTEKTNCTGLKVLNIGSGPGRDMLEFFKRNPKSKIQFECIELDKKAIEYAKKLCAPYNSHINFINKNIFRYKPEQKYDLIWSAGLFDYLSDKQFSNLLGRLYSLLEENAELVIGNFSKTNPAMRYMEIIGKWYLKHRSKQDLIKLSINSGIPGNNIEILNESLGINLFMHIKKA